MKTITAFGETLDLTEWAERTGLSRRTLEERLRRKNWTGEQIVTAPRFTRSVAVGHGRDGEPREQLVDHMTPWADDDRCWYVVTCHPDGLTLEQVGDMIGVSRERVRQIEEIAFDKLKEDPESFQLLRAALQPSSP